MKKGTRDPNFVQTGFKTNFNTGADEFFSFHTTQDGNRVYLDEGTEEAAKPAPSSASKPTPLHDRTLAGAGFAEVSQQAGKKSLVLPPRDSEQDSAAIDKALQLSSKERAARHDKALSYLSPQKKS